MLAPWLTVVLVLVYYPSVVTLIRSFQRVDLGNADSAPFIGLANYSALLQPDSDFWSSLWITVHIILICLPLESFRHTVWVGERSL